MTSVPGSEMRRFDMGHKVQSMLAPFMHQFAMKFTPRHPLDGSSRIMSLIPICPLLFTFFQLRFYGLHLFNLYLI